MMSLIASMLYCFAAQCTKLIEQQRNKAKVGYFTGITSVLGGIGMGAAATIWAMRLTQEYSFGRIASQVQTLDGGECSSHLQVEFAIYD